MSRLSDGGKNAFDVLMASRGRAKAEKRPAAGVDDDTNGDCDPFLVGASACYRTKEGDTYICGLELRYSNNRAMPWRGKSVEKFGKVAGAKKSESMDFAQDEHIIGVDFEGGAGDGLTSLTLFTSHPEGRNLSFYVSGDDVETLEDFGEYRGVYRDEGEELGPHPYKRGEFTFTCDRGNRVTGMKFKRRTIVRIDQEPIPRGQNEKWWAKSFEYTPPEKPPPSESYKAVPAGANSGEEDNDGSAAGFCFSYTNSDGEDDYTTLPGQSLSGIQSQYRNFEDVSFLRPDGTTESKGIDWCLSNGFFQVEEDLWSGPWFYEKFPKAKVLHSCRARRTEKIRSLCENITPGECESDDYGSYSYGYESSRNDFEHCAMKGGICTCLPQPSIPAQNPAYQYAEACKKRRLEEIAAGEWPKKKKRKRSKSKKRKKKSKHLT